MTAENGANPAGPNSPRDDDSVAESPGPRRRRGPFSWGCGCLTAVAVLAGVAIVVPTIFFAVYGVLDRRWYERELAYVREAGDPLTVEELEAYYPSDPTIERTTELWVRAVDGIAGERTEEEDAIRFRRETHRRDFPGTPVPPLAGDELQRAKALVGRFRESLDVAHEARRSGAVARYDVPFEVLGLVHNERADGLRDLVLLLALDAEIRLVENDPDGAIECVATMFAAGESLRNEPIFSSQLSRAGCIRLAAQLVPEIVANGEASDEALVRLQQAFAGIDMSEGYRRAVRGERVGWLHIIRGEFPEPDHEYAAFASLPFRDADAAKTLEYYRLVAEAADKNLLAVGEPMGQVDIEFERIAASPIDRRRFPLTAMFLTDMGGIAGSVLSSQALANGASAAIACERYRRDRGSFPASLSDLTPTYLPNVPLDPLAPSNGQSLRYVVDEEGALIYSIGRDQVDDGGIDDWSEGDLPFRLIDGATKNEDEGANSR